MSPRLAIVFSSIPILLNGYTYSLNGLTVVVVNVMKVYHTVENFTYLTLTTDVFIISRRALAREGDYEMMPVCACVHAGVCVCVHACVR